jgi:hypothetical protein
MILGLIFALSVEIPVARCMLIYSEKYLRKETNGVSWSDEMQQLRSPKV